ncbi:hypothetical protein BDV32DRAFT_119797 [Aspergillus pseudonomiae]|nr:hypothetical protein BDV32DRAFT_119797 [Aspergillus pseudonomiae]
MQQSHSSSPQSQPKHGFWTDLMGFLMEDPELEDGRMKFTGEEIEEAPILTVGLYVDTMRFFGRQDRVRWDYDKA